MDVSASPYAAQTNRRIAIIGAPSSIGIRPYDDGGARRLDLTPGVLRGLGLVRQLDAADRGDVVPPPYVDFVRPPGGVRNERAVEVYSRALADAVEQALMDGYFPLIVGGDCSIVLGSLLGAGRHAGRVGLAYVDGHADFATPEESATGSAASMCLALAVGRGDTALARLADAPLVCAQDVALIGRRDEGEPYGHDALRDSGILDLSDTVIARTPLRVVTARALERIAKDGVAGFWVHVDADVIDPEVMPAVDSPEPVGPGLDEMTELLVPLITHPRALGMQVTIYDPALDRDHAAGARLVDLLTRVLAPRLVAS